MGGGEVNEGGLLVIQGLGVASQGGCPGQYPIRALHDRNPQEQQVGELSGME